MADPQTASETLMQGAMHWLTRIFARCGIVLIVAPTGAPKDARANYISNCERAEMLVLLKEVVARFEGRAHNAPETKQ